MHLDWIDGAVLGALGLLIGSFLNVVIYRLPIMLEAQWADECAQLSGASEDPPAETAAPPFNLLAPRSRCSHCGHQLAWWENVPVLSFVFLGGKCSECKTAYGWRYPAVEVATGLAFFYCGWRWGLSGAAIAWCGFSAALLALALIDWDTTLLPDDVTLPLVWAGLVVAALGVHPETSLSTAFWGAVAGYLSLWLVYWGFKLLTGKEGMGFGDFKLFAALGAWFGWPALIPIILISSVIGAVVGLSMKFTSGLREGGYVPFGPFLAGAGFFSLFFGPDALLRWLGQ